MDDTALDDTALKLRELIPSFELPAVNRSPTVSPWHYKQRNTLAIFLFHHAACHACCNVLLSLAQQHQIYRTLEAEVLAVSTAWQLDGVESLQKFAERHAIPFPILWDQQGQVSCAYLGKTDRSPVGIFVCDRFGELYMQAVADEADQLPDEHEIRSWVEFVDMQCPECFPPSWR
jgi:peroxiredoxin